MIRQSRAASCFIPLAGFFLLIGCGQDTDTGDVWSDGTDGYSDVTQDDSYCQSQNIECGLATDPRGDRVFCGNCQTGKSCQAGVCEDAPDDCRLASCETLGAQCGEWDDGCSGELFCGSCPDGDVCDKGTCVRESGDTWDGTTDDLPDDTTDDGSFDCDAKSCEDLGMQCGQCSDGCGGTLSCGECDGGTVCDGGQCVDPSTVSHSRVENPFAQASYYINPEYVSKVESSKQRVTGQLKEKVEKVKSFPTAVWLDTIAAVNGYQGRMGLEGHLNEALKQGKNATEPMLAVIVVYDLPNRDCAAMASNGELQGAQGMQRYKAEYIGKIVDILKSNPAYQKLRIAAIIEPDSLPNLVTNINNDTPNCIGAQDLYREGVQHAVAQLATLKNVYMYLDIAHSGWLGWEHTAKAAQLYKEILKDGLLDSVSGFATNVANYSSLEEPFNPYEPWDEANRDIIVDFYEWNRVIDEVSFVALLKQQFPDKGFIIDTSRNGWSPRGEKMPLDARIHRGNWCNQDNTGLGERPRPNPSPQLHAYFWIKPPGESDGTSNPNEQEDLDNPTTIGKRFDPMCGVEPVVRPYSKGIPVATGALGNAPHAGMWFHEQFMMFVENAQPPL